MYVYGCTAAHPIALKRCSPTLVHQRRCCGAAESGQATRGPWSTWCAAVVWRPRSHKAPETIVTDSHGNWRPSDSHADMWSLGW